MKNIFLDCGTHFGQGLQHISNIFNMDSTWYIESYEANPITYDLHFNDRKFNYVNYKNIGISTYDGTIKLNIESPAEPHPKDTGMASSIVDLNIWNPQNGNLKFEKNVLIDCIDFSNYILKNFNKNDFIVCKFDIEGAEYDILEKMIKDNTINYINHFFIEFHASYFKNENEIKIKENFIINELNKAGVILHTWS